MRLAWGRVQEAAALHALLAVFPDCRLEEVGMFAPPLDQLPGSWGAAAAAAAAGGGGAGPALPPLGASPDGMVCHELSWTYGELRAAVADWRAGHGAAAARALLEAGLARVRCAAPAAAAQADALAGALAATGLSQQPEGGSSGTDSSGSGSGGGGGGTAAGRAAAASAAAAEEASPCGGLAGATVEERLVAFIAAAAAELRPPPAGGGPWATPSSSGGGGGSSKAGAAAAAAAEAPDGARYPRTLWVREVVEVKSHCPFLMKGRRRGRKGRPVVDYAMTSSCVPAGRLKPQWVPQLQFHMLCSGAASALLVSRTPHSGLRVFRVFRDDGYLSLLLGALSALAAAAAAARGPPAAAAFLETPGQSEALARTVEIARAAVAVAEAGCGGSEEIVPPACLQGSNLSAFI